MGGFRKAVRTIVLLASCFFAALALKFLLVDGEPLAAAGALLFSLPASGIFLFLRDVQEETDPLHGWLVENAAQIKQGTALHDGAPFRLETALTRFGGCTSIIIWSGRFRSPLRVEGSTAARFDGLLYSAVTLVTGWWGLHGLFWTIPALIENLRGGKRITVEELLKR